MSLPDHLLDPPDDPKPRCAYCDGVENLHPLDVTVLGREDAYGCDVCYPERDLVQEAMDMVDGKPCIYQPSLAHLKALHHHFQLIIANLQPGAIHETD